MLVILPEIGEEPLRDMEDITLSMNIEAMNESLRQFSDDFILNAQVCKIKRNVILQELYLRLALILHYVKPSLIGSVSLRMVELTISQGLTPTAPVAFAYYGETLASMGNITDGCRLGKIL